MKTIKTFTPPLIVFLVLLVLWQLLIHVFEIPEYNLPGPGLVVISIMENFNELFQAFIHTARSALTGYFISLAIGFTIAVFLSRAKWIERSFMPYTLFFQTVPVVAIAPLIIQWVEYGPKGVIIVVCIISLFPVIANTHHGLTKIDDNYRKLFKLYRSGSLALLIKLQIPHCIPHFLMGARISCGLAVIGAIVGEFFTGYNDAAGLGYLIQFSSSRLKTDYLFACIFSSTLLGFLMYALVNLLSRYILFKYQRGVS